MKSKTVRIDNSAPVTTSDWHDVYVDQAVLTLSPSDPYSGVTTTKYRVDGGAWQTGTQVTVTGYYSHSVEFYSVDACGNTEAPKTVWFRIRMADQVFEQTAAEICYKGVWDKYAFGGYGARSTDPTAVAHFLVQGTRVILYGYTGPDMGIGRFVLDDGTPVLIDFYSSVQTGRVWSFDSGVIAYGNHTARLEYTGTKNVLSTGYAIGFDAIRAEGDLLQVPDTARAGDHADLPDRVGAR